MNAYECKASIEYEKSKRGQFWNRWKYRIGLFSRLKERGDPSAGNIEQKADGAEHEYKEKNGCHQPSTDTAFAAIEVGPTPHEEIEGKEVDPGDGRAHWRAEHSRNPHEGGSNYNWQDLSNAR